MNLIFHSIQMIEARGADMAPPLVETAAWIRNTIAQPHPQLGRPGPICSKVPAALVYDSLWLGLDCRQNHSRETITDSIRALTEVFFRLSPVEMPKALFKGVMLLFDNSLPDETVALIEIVQREHKMRLIEAGLLLGKFHRDSRNTAMNNKDFHPSQSPYPMLGLRPILENDVKFMLAHQDQSKLIHLKRFLQSERNYLPGKYACELNGQ